MHRAGLARLACGALLVAWGSMAFAAEVVPPEIEQPGTQPLEVSNLESPDKCDNCHGGYNSAVEPAHNWRGSMMAHAGRDPIFWATMAIAEQDFNGSGDLCLRCHSTSGWLAGRSTPTDGSGLTVGDADGVDCDYCHKLTNPDDSELQGVMNPPFVANEPNVNDAVHDWDNPNGIEGYLGSGISSVSGGNEKLGPYDNAAARHQFLASQFHRDRDFCGTCHDVSNPAVGELAHNFGAMSTQDQVQLGSGLPADTVAFNNPPYRYGIVERTFSEYKSAQIARTLVDDYPGLPADLRGGVLEAVWASATANGTRSANYQNPDAPRYYSCQTCHLRPVTGLGANKEGVPVRSDLPLHDMTGGNYWMAEAIVFLDARGDLVLGGGMTAAQVTAMRDGADRARAQLGLAASLSIVQEGERFLVKVVNHTGHKLISGYPEGRRMWLNIRWRNASGALVREDGAWGELRNEVDEPVLVAGVAVKSLLDPDGPHTRVYEAHMGLSQEWAAQLVTLGYDPDLPLAYDRLSHAPTLTLGALAAAPAGTVAETFHFVLNNVVVKDNRIPPYGMNYQLARERNALPQPPQQYGGRGGETFRYYDLVPLDPPAGAVTAEIRLLYQPTSWEYIQFLWLANDRSSPFLGEEGQNMLDAWLATGMAAPHTMAQIAWGVERPPHLIPGPDLIRALSYNQAIRLLWEPAYGEPLPQAFRVYYDQGGMAQRIVELPCTAGAPASCTQYVNSGLTNGQTYCYKVSGVYDGSETPYSNVLCGTPKPGAQLNPASEQQTR